MVPAGQTPRAVLIVEERLNKEGISMKPSCCPVPSLTGVVFLALAVSSSVADTGDRYAWRFQFGSVCT
jgi:hypothetical protein